MKRKLLMIGKVLVYALIYFIVFKLASHVWYNALIKIDSIGNWAQKTNLGAIVLNDLFGIPIFAGIVFLLKKRSLLKVAHFNKMNINHFISSTIIGVCMGIFLINSFNLPFFKQIPIFETILVFLYDSNLSGFLMFVLLGTVFKEILFRGLIFNELKKEMNIIIAILLHGVIYGALFFYFNIPLTLFGILGNVVVVLAYIYSGSIWAAYTAQVFNNLTVYFFRHYSNDFFVNKEIQAIIFSIVVMFFSLYIMYKHRTINTTKSTKKEVIYEAS